MLRASTTTWKRVLDGQLEPIFGLMSGQLKLGRGNLAKLTPYMNARKNLQTRPNTVYRDNLNIYRSLCRFKKI